MSKREFVLKMMVLKKELVSNLANEFMEDTVSFI